MSKFQFLKPRKLGAFEWIVLIVIFTGIYFARHGWPS